MIIAPKISNDAATAGSPNNPANISAAHARRNSESKNSASATQDSAADAVESNAADSSLDIPDSQTADAIMNSLRAGILAQPGATAAVYTNLSPQSVYDLLR